jgi:hypothetical protein
MQKDTNDNNTTPVNNAFTAEIALRSGEIILSPGIKSIQFSLQKNS